jgi:hypothetical protein
VPPRAAHRLSYLYQESHNASAACPNHRWELHLSAVDSTPNALEVDLSAASLADVQLCVELYNCSFGIVECPTPSMRSLGCQRYSHCVLTAY